MRLRSLVELTLPEVEPVSLAAAKGQLGLLPEQEDDDALILRLVSTARELVERRLGVTLATRQYRATFVADDGLAWSELPLPVPPLLVDGSHPLAVAVGGVAVSSASYAIDADSRPGVVRFSAVPQLGTDGTVAVTFWAGPPVGRRIAPGLESVILLLVGLWFRNREAVITGTIATELPMAVETLLAAHSVSGAW